MLAKLGGKAHVRYYQEAEDDEVFSAEKHRALAAEAFSRVVRTLHGGEAALVAGGGLATAAAARL